MVMAMIVEPNVENMVMVDSGCGQRTLMCGSENE